MEQAQRIAKWKTTYDKLKYSFELVNICEYVRVLEPENTREAVKSFDCVNVLLIENTFVGVGIAGIFM